MKMKRILALVTAFVMLLAVVPGSLQEAKAADSATLVNASLASFEAVPGESTHIKLAVKSNGNFITSPRLSVTLPEGSPFTVSNLKLTESNGIVISYIPNEGESYLEFDLATKESATIGTYDIDINVSYTDYFTVNEYGEPTITTDVIALKGIVRQEKMPIQLTASNFTYNEAEVVAGKTFAITFTIKNEGEIDAYNVYCGLDLGAADMIPGYSLESMKLPDLPAGASTKLTLPLEVLGNAAHGLKTIGVLLSCKDIEGNEMSFNRKAYVTVQNIEEVSSDAAKLKLSAVAFNESLDAGKDADVSVLLQNIGGETATNISVSVINGAGVELGIIPRYTTDGVTVANIAKGKEATVQIPLLISEDAPAGLRALTISASYTDADGIERSSEVDVYVTIVTKQTESERLVNEVAISNVTQDPATPEAGKEIKLSFKLENKGNKEITGVRLAGDGLSSAGFEPLNSEPYQTIGNIAAGASKNVTMTFKVGRDISEGLNQLAIVCYYKDAAGEQHQETTTVYILNVQNNSDSGKPKLIISDFSTDAEQLLAGSTFNYYFTIVNTHASKAAKNIKVTITQDENVFAAASGSNSFYIQNIDAGASQECSMELKVRSDAMTGAYDLNILVEYEYDDMSKTDSDNGGVSENNKVKLSATENARPVVENISMYDSYSYDTPTVNSEATMTFEFYNMGRSSLNNVYITVEGDFALANGTMHYVGTVGAGSAEYIEPMVMPLVEGEAVCIIVVHFEDSNGDEVTKSTEYTTYVQAAGGGFAWEDPGYDDPYGPTEPVGPVDIPKEPILSLWMFIALQAAVLVVGMLATRGIIVAVKKAKIKKQADAE